MEESSNAGGQRLRLTCTPCYRRKIKCNKAIPCSTCVRRGYANLCARHEDNTAAVLGTLVDEESRGSSKLVQTLLDRVDQLEAQLLSQHDALQIGSRASAHQSFPRTPLISDQGDHAPIPTSVERSPKRVQNTSLPHELGSVAPDAEDAATVLEFLAWGRSKDIDYGRTSQQPNRFLSAQHDDHSTANAIFESSRQATLDLLDIQLPDPAQVRQLSSYHNTYLLWYHGSYSSWIFGNDLDKFLINFHRNVRHPDLDLQWLALLFAILTGSLACAPPSVRHSWGFRDTETSALALRWYESSVSCLQAGRYIENHSIHSVEAIATLTISAHILGRSNSQSVLLSSAGRIAQSLGLHRLSTDDHVSIEQLRQRESARRVFNQLCTQDWFQIPFSESYSLNPRFTTTIEPMNCNDDDLQCQPQSVPTQASYCNYRYKIAALMPHLLDATTECNTPFTKYEQVLKYDEQMRRLATTSMPAFLSAGTVIASDWPVWIKWARRSLTICAAHKIIMIHRRFLGLSFTNTAFSFTRRTCIAAAKTILKEALSNNDPTAPVLWIEQAFSVAAGIVLSLDIAHSEHNEDDLKQHAALMDKTISYLKCFEASKIASRGAQLLSALQNEVQRRSFRAPRKRLREAENPMTVRPAKVTRMSSRTDDTPRLDDRQPPTESATEASDIRLEGASWDALSDCLPFDFTLGPQDLFDDLLSFQF